MLVDDASNKDSKDAVSNLFEQQEQHGGRKILLIVFQTIVIGTLKDIFNATVGVLWKFVKHLALCFYYFWSPDIDRPPFSTFNFKEFCKHSFEGVIITLIFSFFMAKVGWFATTDEWVKEQISNSDLIEIQYEALAFIAFAVTYFLLIALSLATGRGIRKWLTPEVSRKESDILMITFFNSFFSLTALTALLIRCVVPFADNDFATIIGGTGVILIAICFVLTAVWAIRFLYLNNVRGLKTILFFLLSVIIYTIMFSIGGIITTLLLYIV